MRPAVLQMLCPKKARDGKQERGGEEKERGSIC